MGIPNLAIRIHGKRDLRLDRFELPEPKADEILAEVITNSICMSCHKAAQLGAEHKRVPNDVADNPTILGHEFAGIIRQVGSKWKDRYAVGDKFAIQPAVRFEGSMEAPGYSFPTIGGNAQQVVVPGFIIESDCLLPYQGTSFFRASLAEPLSCVICACRAQYHMEPGRYEHQMGIKPGGNLALLGGAGPMGLATLTYLLGGPVQPGRVLIADRNEAKLNRARALFPPETGRAAGVTLDYLHFRDGAAPDEFVAQARGLTGGNGYDDLLVFSPAPAVVEMGDALLGYDGCLNFFAGPVESDFTARFNFFDVHYAQHHVVGTSGGTQEDMVEALELLSAGKVDPAGMVTHVGGLDAVIDTTLNLPNLPGGKKLIYTHLTMPMTSIAQFADAAERAEEPYKTVFTDLHAIVARHSGLWNDEAESYLLARTELRCEP